MKSLFIRILDFRSWLSKPHLPLSFALLSVLLSSQALNIGLMMDDWWQRYYFLHRKPLCGQSFTGFFVQFFGADGTRESFRKCKDNRPQRVKFSFDKPLEDKSYKFLQWTDDGYTPFKLLSVGETAIIPATKTLPEVMQTML